MWLNNIEDGVYASHHIEWSDRLRLSILYTAFRKDEEKEKMFNEKNIWICLFLFNIVNHTNEKDELTLFCRQLQNSQRFNWEQKRNAHKSMCRKNKIKINKNILKLYMYVCYSCISICVLSKKLKKKKDNILSHSICVLFKIGQMFMFALAFFCSLFFFHSIVHVCFAPIATHTPSLNFRFLLNENSIERAFH